MLAELKAAAMIKCEYCFDIGSAIAHGAGVTEEQLLALPRYRESDEFGELESSCSTTQSGISRTPVERLRRAVRAAARALRRAPAGRADERDRAGEHARRASTAPSA